MVGDGGPAVFVFVEFGSAGGDAVSAGGLVDEVEHFGDEAGAVLGVDGEEGAAFAEGWAGGGAGGGEDGA